MLGIKCPHGSRYKLADLGFISRFINLVPRIGWPGHSPALKPTQAGLERLHQLALESLRKPRRSYNHILQHIGEMGLQRRLKPFIQSGDINSISFAQHFLETGT
ncbi:hypothetical protein SAMN02949497_3649 [Methylomagnum ishizawai]|uniref:Uncharacterized protein n=1 Tax=Methylomagnum ishizawai TaxID=1760988 RepID=A0A1Y6D0T1_9GAMM|nr:hypothetical protein SAMN02949497_3649 [Methylomagnum ishizawai]